MMYQTAVVTSALEEVQKNSGNAGPWMVLTLVILGVIIYVLYNEKLKREKLKEAADLKKQENKDAAVFNVHEFKKMFEELLKENKPESEEMKAKADTRLQVAVIKSKQAGIEKTVEVVRGDVKDVREDMEDVRSKLGIACHDIGEIKETIKTLKKE